MFRAPELGYQKRALGFRRLFMGGFLPPLNFWAGANTLKILWVFKQEEILVLKYALNEDSFRAGVVV